LISVIIFAEKFCATLHVLFYTVTIEKEVFFVLFIAFFLRILTKKLFMSFYLRQQNFPRLSNVRSPDELKIFILFYVAPGIQAYEGKYFLRSALPVSLFFLLISLR
jgi:hypothetical protein